MLSFTILYEWLMKFYQYDEVKCVVCGNNYTPMYKNIVPQPDKESEIVNTCSISCFSEFVHMSMV